eukprot:Gb_30057 [translate_table: standard]
MFVDKLLERYFMHSVL